MTRSTTSRASYSAYTDEYSHSSTSEDTVLYEDGKIFSARNVADDIYFIVETVFLSEIPAKKRYYADILASYPKDFVAGLKRDIESGIQIHPSEVLSGVRRNRSTPSITGSMQDVSFIGMGKDYDEIKNSQVNEKNRVFGKSVEFTSKLKKYLSVEIPENLESIGISKDLYRAIKHAPNLINVLKGQTDEEKEDLAYKLEVTCDSGIIESFSRFRGDMRKAASDLIESFDLENLKDSEKKHLLICASWIKEYFKHTESFICLYLKEVNPKGYKGVYREPALGATSVGSTATGYAKEVKKRKEELYDIYLSTLEEGFCYRIHECFKDVSYKKEEASFEGSAQVKFKINLRNPRASGSIETTSWYSDLKFLAFHNFRKVLNLRGLAAIALDGDYLVITASSLSKKNFVIAQKVMDIISFLRNEESFYGLELEVGVDTAHFKDNDILDLLLGFKRCVPRLNELGLLDDDYQDPTDGLPLDQQSIREYQLGIFKKGTGKEHRLTSESYYMSPFDHHKKSLVTFRYNLIPMSLLDIEARIVMSLCLLNSRTEDFHNSVILSTFFARLKLPKEYWDVDFKQGSPGEPRNYSIAVGSNNTIVAGGRENSILHNRSISYDRGGLPGVASTGFMGTTGSTRVTGETGALSSSYGVMMQDITRDPSYKRPRPESGRVTNT